jgi:hypothetical protein
MMLSGHQVLRGRLAALSGAGARGPMGLQNALLAHAEPRDVGVEHLVLDHRGHLGLEVNWGVGHLLIARRGLVGDR